MTEVLKRPRGVPWVLRLNQTTWSARLAVPCLCLEQFGRVRFETEHFRYYALDGAAPCENTGYWLERFYSAISDYLEMPKSRSTLQSSLARISRPSKTASSKLFRFGLPTLSPIGEQFRNPRTKRASTSLSEKATLPRAQSAFKLRVAFSGLDR
jgi:hypothetical protein